MFTKCLLTSFTKYVIIITQGKTKTIKEKVGSYYG